MFRELVLREFLDNVKSFRFLLSALIVVAVFLLSAILSVNEYAITAREYRENDLQNLRALESKSKVLNQLATHAQRLLNLPSVLQFACGGFEAELPNAIYVNAFSVGSTDHIARSNFLVPDIHRIDWVFVIGVLLSFVALALTFDGISREKEDGTLRLVMTNALPRYFIILAKYVGGLIALMIPVAVGILLSLIIVTVTGYSILTATHWAQILLMVIVSFVYLSIYVLLGLLISTLTHRTATSLVFCLILWVVTTLLVPNIGGLLAGAFQPIASQKEIEAKIDLARREVWTRYPADAHTQVSLDPFLPGHRFRADMNKEMLEVEVKIREAYLAEQIHQLTWGRQWTRLSPSAVYQYASENIMNAGIPRFLSFKQQVENYREQLLDYVKRKDALDPDSPHWINPYDDFLYSNKPMPFKEIPTFEYKERDLRESFTGALIDFALLLFTNALFLTLAGVTFNRYDVR